jgi:lycopene cyclase domain-containing protein
LFETLSYLGFHLIFTIPPIVVVAVILFVRHRSNLLAMLPGIALIAAVAVLYTTPWDNYLVFKEVWTYGDDRVLGTIGYVPLEEYAFFVLQTILTGLLLGWRIAVLGLPTRDTVSPAVKWAVGLGLVAVSVIGLVALFSESTLYFGLIAAWAFPILALQWFVGTGFLGGSTRLWIPVVVGVTIYLASADAVAIASGTWAISTKYTTGLLIGSLPIEEGLFFFVTNLLVGWGLTLVWGFSNRRERPTP